MSNLPALKSHCMVSRNLSEAYPNNKTYMIDYEKAQRAVKAKEREVFCSIKESK